MSTSFNRVCESFRRRLDTDLSDKFQYATIADLRDAIEEIQKDQAQRSCLRNLTKIRHFLNGLEQYAGVLEVFVQVKPDILGLIWGPIKFCLQIASRTVNAFDALLDAYQKIGESLPIFSAIDEIFCSKPHVQQVLANVYEDILDFHKRSIVFFRQGTWRLTLKLAHHTFDDIFGDVLRNLERSKGLLMDAASVAHFRNAQQERLSWEKEYKERMEKDQKSRMRVVVEWLSADRGHTDQHNALQKLRLELPQSGTWINKRSPFKDWLREDNGKSLVFWLTGIPGAGKTVLFSSVVDQINKSYPKSETIHFYCKVGDPHYSTFNRITRSLISQILLKDTGYLDYIYNTIIASQEHRPISSPLLKKILEALVIYRSSVFIAIDGLDECEEDERSKILSFVSDVSIECGSKQNVKFFLTSRIEKDLKLSLKSAFSLNIEPEYVEGDIRAYVKLQTAKLSRKFDFDIRKESEIAKEVQTRPKGMFLLARLIMENLIIQDTTEELEEELKSDILPNGIDEAYGRLLVRIGKGRSGKIGPEKSRQRAALILSILATSKRPLTVNEIQGAISISLSDRTVDFNGRRLRDSFEELCGPIVESGLNGAIGLIHPTAKAYLLQKHSGPYMNSSDAEFKMAMLCASYLSFDCFRPETSQRDLLQYSGSGSYAFQLYAVCNWVHHVQSLKDCWEFLDNSDCTLIYNACGVLLERELQRQCPKIFPASMSEKPSYAALNKALSPLYDEYERVGSISDNGIPPTMQHMHQVRTAVEHLFSTSTDLSASKLLTDSYGSLLFRCPILKCPSFHQGFATQSARDHHYKVHEPPFACPHQGCEYKILGFLVEEALNNAIDKDDLAAIDHLANELSSIVDRNTGFLLRAVQRGSQKSAILISKLLGTAAEFTHAVKGRTAVSEAATKGYTEVLKNFLNSRETSHVRIATSKTVFLIAAENGHEAVVRLLLDKGVASVNDLDYGWRALYRAAKSGHEAIIRLLLGSRANIAAVSKREMIPALYIAARNGHAAVVDLLLQTSSIHHSMTDDNRSIHFMNDDKVIVSALHEAASRGHKAIAQLLLERGVEADADKGIGQTALRKANSRREDETDLRLLLDGNPYYSGSSVPGLTALHLAARNGHEALAQLLLDKGSNIEGKTKDMRTALHEAAISGHEAVVKLLLKQSADIKAEDESGSTAFHLAAGAGHVAVVRLLLDQSPDITAVRRDGSTALHIAAFNGREAVVQLLLDQRADITAVTGDGKTALHYAALFGHEALARLLLDNGADVKVKDSYENTAMVMAVRKGCEAFVRLFLDRKADVTSKNIGGYTALHSAAQNGYEALAHLLLEEGSNIEGKTKDMRTALHLAAISGHEAVVRLLLNRNADITAEEESGFTAFHLAVINGHEAVALLLLDKGAEIDARIVHGHIALYNAVKKGHEAVVRLLLDRGADIQAIDNDGWTALHIAASNNRESLVQMLLDRGADVTAQDDHGLTAFQLADSNGREGRPTAQLLRSLTHAGRARLLQS